MAEVPTGTFPESAIPSAIDILAASGACSSKSEARRLVQGGGVYLNGRRLGVDDQVLAADLLEGRHIFFRLGKKRFFAASRA
jgi:tyrosyl-tRNA synthetase